MKFLIIFATIVVLVLCQFDDDIPPFLKGAPQSTIKEFETILQNGQSQTDQQLDANINAWIAKQTSAIQVILHFVFDLLECISLFYVKIFSNNRSFYSPKSPLCYKPSPWQLISPRF